MRITIKLSIGVLATILATSCSKELSIGKSTPKAESRESTILIQESHTDEVGNLQVSAYFLDENGDPQTVGDLTINDQLVNRTGDTYSGDGISKNILGKKTAITIYSDSKEVLMQDSLFLADAIQIEMPKEVKTGTEIRWNINENITNAAIEITLRYDSKAPYNEGHGFDENQVTQRAVVNEKLGVFKLDESFFQDIPDGAWVRLSVSRTVTHKGSFLHKDQELPYSCNWISTDLHTVRFMN